LDHAGFHRPALEQEGFVGWLSFPEARNSSLCPHSGGVYVVVYEGPQPTSFSDANPAGRFKGQDPSVPLASLTANWVPDAKVVYIGKADQLRRRITQFADFGAGKPIGHWGGRLIWQLPRTDLLTIAWRETPERVPVEVEAELIALFRQQHGKPPFANNPHLLGR
jgi:hypothetical protein